MLTKNKHKTKQLCIEQSLSMKRHVCFDITGPKFCAAVADNTSGQLTARSRSLAFPQQGGEEDQNGKAKAACESKAK